MNKKQKEEQIKLFAEAFHEVVVPLLENMTTKDDLNEAVDKIERRIDKTDDRLDRYGKMLDNHEKRIGSIETRANIAAT
jgi:prefoldin subunit 5